MTKRKILLAEDELPIRKFIHAGLAADEYKIIDAISAKEAIQGAASHTPDLLLLDLGLPDADGLEVIRRVREWSQVPIIVISARGQEMDKIEALDSGADDYLTKPFSMSELLARMRVAFRRGSAAVGGEPRESSFEVVGLKVDFAERRVWADGQEKHLTPLEYKLLSALITNAGRVMTHKQLLQEVWGPAYLRQSQYLRVYMRQLRHKLEIDPARPRYLTTEPGVGYRFKID